MGWSNMLDSVSDMLDQPQRLSETQLTIHHTGSQQRDMARDDRRQTTGVESESVGGGVSVCSSCCCTLADGWLTGADAAVWSGRVDGASTTHWLQAVQNERLPLPLPLPLPLRTSHHMLHN